MKRRIGRDMMATKLKQTFETDRQQVAQ